MLSTRQAVEKLTNSTSRFELVMADELGTQRFAKNYINQSETVGYNANPYEVQAEKWAQSQFDYWMDVLESY